MRKRSLLLFIMSLTVSAVIFAETGTTRELLSQNGFSIPKKTLPSVDFTLEDLAGVKRTLTDYRGKVVFLNFWASWCGPCRFEMPSMEKLYSEFKKDGLEILAVNLGESAPVVQKFMEEYNLSFPALLDKEHTVSTTYGARSIPTTYLIGRDGNILGMTVGAREWDSPQLRDFFKEILQ